MGGGVAEFGGKETKLKFLGQITIGGLIPSQIVDLTAVRTLTDFAEMRVRFSKDYEVDLAKREHLVHEMTASVTKHHSQHELDEIERGSLLFQTMKNCEGARSRCSLSNSFVKGVSAKFQGKNWVKLTATVRCDAYSAMSFLMNVGSRALLSEDDYAETQIVEDESLLDEETNRGDFTQVVNVQMSTVRKDGLKFKNNIVRRMVWKKMSRSKMVFRVYATATEFATAKPQKQRERSFSNRSVRPTLQSDTVASWRFTQISPTMTTVELLSDPEAATKRKKNFYHKEKHRGRRNLGSLSFDKPNARKLGKREVSERSERALRKTRESRSSH